MYLVAHWALTDARLMTEAFKKELSCLDSLLLHLLTLHLRAFSKTPKDPTHLCDFYTSAKLGWNQESGLKNNIREETPAARSCKSLDLFHIHLWSTGYDRSTHLTQIQAERNVQASLTRCCRFRALLVILILCQETGSFFQWLLRAGKPGWSVWGRGISLLNIFSLVVCTVQSCNVQGFLLDI